MKMVETSKPAMKKIAKNAIKHPALFFGSEDSTGGDVAFPLVMLAEAMKPPMRIKTSGMKRANARDRLLRWRKASEGSRGLTWQVAVFPGR